MYATVRRYEGVTNPSEVTRQVKESFLPLISEIPGFVAYYLVDASGGVVPPVLFKTKRLLRNRTEELPSGYGRVELHCSQIRRRPQRVGLSRTNERARVNPEHISNRPNEGWRGAA